MRRRSLFVSLASLAVLLIGSGPAVPAGDPSPGQVPVRRPAIGLVLSGGGARGLAHIGVLRVLEEWRVPVDYVAGTSMGAVIGGLYASGLDADEIEQAVEAIDWVEIFEDSAPRREKPYRRKRDDELALFEGRIGVKDGALELAPGVLRGQQVHLLLKRLTKHVAGTRDFDRLPIPFRAVATDLNTGDAVVLDRGELAMAMRASMAIPAVFAPVSVQGRVLVDGGISNNLPVNVVKGMGADVIIAVDVATPLHELNENASVLKVIDQLSNILVQRNAARQREALTEQDALIVPKLGKTIRSLDFTEGERAQALGAEAVTRHRDRLAALSVSVETWRAHLVRREARRKPDPVIHFVRVDNRSRYQDEILERRIRITTGQTLDLDEVEASIARIDGLDVFQEVSWELVREGGRSGLVIHAVEDQRGPGYLVLGLTLSGNSGGRNYANVRAGYHRVPATGSGGEWRVLGQLGDDAGLFGEVWQPLEAGLRAFVRPFGFWRRYDLNVLNESGERRADARVRRSGLGLGVGRELARWGQVEAGVRRYGGTTSLRNGLPGIQTGNFDGGEWFLRFNVDTLNNLYFPRNGQFVRFEYLWSREALGADEAFEQAILDAFVGGSRGPHTLLGGLRAYSTVEGSAPLQNLFRAGGFTRLSGFTLNELSGDQFAMLFAGYMHRFGVLFKMTAYAGATLEYGNVWQSRSAVSLDRALAAGSLFLGLDSPLGPAYVGLGVAEGGQQTLFLYFGQLP